MNKYTFKNINSPFFNPTPRKPCRSAFNHYNEQNYSDIIQRYGYMLDSDLK